MARSRNIKPAFFHNEELAECSPLARLLFIGLWCIADKAGRLEDRPKRIRAEVFPYDFCDCESLLQELHSAGFIVRYSVESVALIQVVNFLKHQNPHPKESNSTLPAFNGESKSVERLEHALEIPEQEMLIPSSLIPDSLIPNTDTVGKPSCPAQVPDTPKAKKWGTDDDHKAARFIFKKVRLVDQTAKEPNWPAWANEIRLMREQDKRTHREICELFEWANADQFWRANVLSPGKLREKWTQLQAKRGSNQQSGRPSFDAVKERDYGESGLI